MLRDKPLHNFLFELEDDGFYDGLETYCTPWIDMCVILKLIKKYKPKTFLEIGTHKGYTTRNIKRKFPDLLVTTVDPGDKVPLSERSSSQLDQYLTQEEIGCLLKQYPDVVIHRERFERIDFADQKFDFIFIDGNHSYNDVVSSPFKNSAK